MRTVNKKIVNRIIICYVVFIFTITSLPMLTNQQPVKALSAEIWVSGSMGAGWYDASHVHTLTEANANLSSGGQVHIWAGIYAPVIITKTSTWRGNGTSNTAISSSMSWTYPIEVTANLVVINHLTLMNSSVWAVYQDSIYSFCYLNDVHVSNTDGGFHIYGSDNYVEYCNVTGNADGVACGTNCEVYYSDFHACSDYAIFGEGDGLDVRFCNFSGNGLTSSSWGNIFLRGDNAIIYSCHFWNETHNDGGSYYGEGIGTDDAHNLLVQDCNFYDCYIGIEFRRDVFNAHVYECYLDGGAPIGTNYGIYSSMSKGTVIEDCHIFNYAYGVELRSDITEGQTPPRGNHEIFGSYLYDNSMAIQVYGEENVTIHGNTFAGNDYVFNLYGSNDFYTKNVTIYNNIFQQNGEVIEDYPLTLAYDIKFNVTKTAGLNIIGGPYLGGNYWNESHNSYAGTDINGDGLGDTNLPYHQDSRWCYREIEYYPHDYSPNCDDIYEIIDGDFDSYNVFNDNEYYYMNFSVPSYFTFNTSSGDTFYMFKTEIGNQYESIPSNAKDDIESAGYVRFRFIHNSGDDTLYIYCYYDGGYQYLDSIYDYTYFYDSYVSWGSDTFGDYHPLLTLPASYFISTWDTTLTSGGSSNSTSIALPLESTGTYDFYVNWGDSTTTHVTSYTQATHWYSGGGGVKTVNISGTIIGWRFNNGGDCLKLTDITHWGCLRVGNNEGYFFGCENLVCTATDALSLTGTTDLGLIFGDCTKFNGAIGNWNTSGVTYSTAYAFYLCLAFNQNIGSWDVSHVTYMRAMFYGASIFNQDISSWNVSSNQYFTEMFEGANAFNQNIGSWDTKSATDMYYMFDDANAFNQPIGSWNTAKVTRMSYMFYHANTFNQNLNTWDTSKVTEMEAMFRYSNFNQPIGNWNTKNVTNMYLTFADTPFNQNINNWNTSKVTTMHQMFSDCSAFNQPIGSWDTSKVTNMNYMFFGTTVFNQSIGNWNTGKVTDMAAMFYQSAFNQPIGDWDTKNVTTMYFMFYGASVFNQPIGSWNTSKVTDMQNMFDGAFVFNQNISNWDTGNVINMRCMFQRAHAFNQPIGSWNTAKVTNMEGMFVEAYVFNKPIGSWNTAKVTSMNDMFASASVFNQPIGSWNTKNVTTMIEMFISEPSFNQNIGSWDVKNVTSMTNMFNGATLSTANYDALLIGWGAESVQSSVTFNGGASKYTPATGGVARTHLISVHGWVITDGGTVGTVSFVYVDDDAAPGWYDASHVHTIQEGVDTVFAGGTVYVWDGTYNYATTTDIPINKTISIIGNGTSTVLITGDCSFIINASHVNISGLHFNDSESFGTIIDYYNEKGYTHCDYAHIYDCLFTHVGKAIKLGYEQNPATRINISNNEFNIDLGAIELSCSNSSIYHNTISHINHGMYLSCCYNVTISYNTMSWAENDNEMIGLWGSGGYYPETSNCNVYNNTMMYGNWTAMYLDNCANNNVIYNNTIIGFNNTDCHGVEFYMSENNLIYNNYFSNKNNSYDMGADDSAIDYSINGNGGVINNAVWNASHLTFNGADSFVDCGNDLSMNITDELTVGAWVYPTINNSWSQASVLNKIDGVGNYQWKIGLNDIGELRFDVAKAAGVWLSPEGGNIPANSWSYIVGTFNSSTGYAKIYINGELVTSNGYLGPFTIRAVNPSLLIGYEPYNGRYFSGSIDDVRVYSRVLTDTEISNLYNHIEPSSTNLQGWWKLDGVNKWNISKTLGTNIMGGPYLGGNYWSDYTGVDNTGDGLGDTDVPYNSKGNIATGGDYLPLVISGPTLLSIAVSPNATDFGVVAIGESAHTTDYHYNLTNLGIECDVAIQFNDSQNWTASTYAGIGYNAFAMNFSDDNWATETNIDPIAGTTIKMYMAQFDYKLFDLKIFMPTASETIHPQNWAITFIVTPS